MSPQSRHRDGRNGHHARQIRRSRNAIRRQMKRMAVSGQQAYATLLAVLAQSGGEVTVTQGTLDQVTAAYDRLGFIVAKTAKDGEFVVRMTEREEPGVSGESLADEGVSCESTTAATSGPMTPDSPSVNAAADTAAIAPSVAVNPV